MSLVVYLDHQDHQVPLEGQEGRENQEHLAYQEILESHLHSLANLLLRLHASLAQPVLLDPQDQQGLLEMLEPQDSLVNKVKMRQMESLGLKDRLDLQAPLDSLDPLESQEHQHSLSQSYLDHLESLEMLDLQDPLDSLDPLELMEAQDCLVQKVHQDPQDLQEMMANQDPLDSQASPEGKERREYVQNIVPLMEGFSLKMELVDVVL